MQQLSNAIDNSTGAMSDAFSSTKLIDVCMILPGGGLRLQTLGGLATQLFDSTLRTRTDAESVIRQISHSVQVRHIVVGILLYQIEM